MLINSPVYTKLETINKTFLFMGVIKISCRCGASDSERICLAKNVCKGWRKITRDVNNKQQTIQFF